MANVPLEEHPLIGTTQTFAPDRPDLSREPVTDPKVVARPGDQVIVRSVFHDWNGVPGLTMCYVYVPATGYHTHMSERELGLVENCRWCNKDFPPGVNEMCREAPVSILYHRAFGKEST